MRIEKNVCHIVQEFCVITNPISGAGGGGGEGFLAGGRIQIVINF